MSDVIESEISDHPFDVSMLLQAQPDGTFSGQTSAAYWNMVGPFGGWIAAVALQAVLKHPALLGEPVAQTVNFAAAIAEGAFTVTATPVRTSRSTQHWVVTLDQLDAQGQPQVVITATVMTAVKRETWQHSDAPMPQVAGPEAVERRELPAGAMAWLSRYDMRVVQGPIPEQWDGSGSHSLSQLWMRDSQPRALDFASLAAMADVFYPRVWLRRASRVAAGTVTMTTYFHASAAQLATVDTGWLMGQAEAQGFRHGFFDQTAQVWSESGILLATSTQLVYFKE